MNTGKVNREPDENNFFENKRSERPKAHFYSSFHMIKENIRDCQRQEDFWRKVKRREVTERRTTGNFNTAAENRKAFREHILKEMRETVNIKEESGVRLEDETERGTVFRPEENSPLLLSKYQHFSVKGNKNLLSMINMTENSNEKPNFSPSSKVNLFLPNSSIDTKTGSANKSVGAFNSITRVLFKHESHDISKAAAQKSMQAINSHIAIQTDETSYPSTNLKLSMISKATQTVHEVPSFNLGFTSKACQTEESAYEVSSKTQKKPKKSQKTSVNSKQKVFFNSKGCRRLDKFINISDLFSTQSKSDNLAGSHNIKSPQLSKTANTRVNHERSTRSSGNKRSAQRDTPSKASIIERLTSKGYLSSRKDELRKSKASSLTFSKLLPVLACANLTPKIKILDALPGPL